MRIWAMIVAAGKGARLAEATAGIPKQFLDWRGAPLYWHSARLFAACARVRGLVFVFPPDRVEAERARLEALGAANLGLPWRAVAGGAERRDSVRLGLRALRLPDSGPGPGNAHAGCDAVLVHDAARPFASPSLTNRVMDALAEAAGVVPGLPVTDTIKEVRTAGEEAAPGEVVTTLPRERLVAVQTPQGFRLDVLAEAHARAEREGWSATDDASLLERCGRRVVVVPGEAGNRKITSPEDLAMLRDTALPFLPRTGWGYDVHKFAAPGPLAGSASSRQPSRPLRLGGIPAPEGPEVLAHSDGDVVLHALMDALLGCAGAGDIGQRYPDTDPAFAGCDSAVLLDGVMEVVRDAGLRVAHVDLTVIAQIPKVAPHREAIRRNVARLLQVDPAAVNVKATTEEGLGFTGEKRGIKAVAVVTALAFPKGEGACGC